MTDPKRPLPIPPEEKQLRCIEEMRVQRILPGPLTLPCSDLLDHDDLTVFVERDQFIQAANDAIKRDGVQIGQRHFPHSIDLSGTIKAGDVEMENARLHAALGFGCSYYSVTIRSKDGGRYSWKLHDPPRFTSKQWTSVEWGRWCSYLAMKSLTAQDWDPPRPASTYLSSKCSAADILHSEVFAKADDDSTAGLVLITGATGTGKTTVLNGLVAKYVAGLSWDAKNKRRSHIVTVGDPVESILYPSQPLLLSNKSVKREVETLNNVGLKACALYQSKNNTSRPTDYTARIVGTDVSCVRHSLEDALRETPRACIVSELRYEDDFRATLSFAATGQLIFATAHNTSLVDAMRKLMGFSGVTDNANTRSLLAQRVKAVVHLRKVELHDAKGKRRLITLPSVWLGNSAGVRSFVCDGLASLLPHGANHTKTDGGGGSFGLAWAAMRMLDSGLVREEHRDILLQRAHVLDLQIR